MTKVATPCLTDFILFRAGNKTFYTNILIMFYLFGFIVRKLFVMHFKKNSIAQFHLIYKYSCKKTANISFSVQMQNSAPASLVMITRLRDLFHWLFLF